MSYIYISSGYFGSQVLKALSTKPSLIITQPDRIGGRGMKTPISTAVKKTAQEKNIPYIEAKSKDELTQIIQQNRSKVVLLSDFGVIVPKDALSAALYGIWNIHPSLLPEYRGPTPVQSAILEGKTKTGITIMQMDEFIDHGPILAQKQVQIDENDTTISLMEKIAQISADLFLSLADDPKMSLNNKKDQDHENATYTKKLNREDGYIESSTIASYIKPIMKKFNLLHLMPTTYDKQIAKELLHNKVRALSPWPGVWTRLPNEKVLKITASCRKNTSIAINKIQIDSKIYEFDTIDYP